jgi:hypothetical protein
VTPETGYFLDKARKLLGEADSILAIRLYDVASMALQQAKRFVAYFEAILAASP